MFRGRLFKFNSVGRSRKTSTKNDTNVDDTQISRSSSIVEEGQLGSRTPRWSTGTGTSSHSNLGRSISTPRLSNLKLLSVGDAYNAFKAGGGQLELKDFALRFKIAPTNVWLKSFGNLCDRHNGTHIGFIELVYICGSIGQKYEQALDKAVSYFLWRLLDAEDLGRIPRAEALRRLQTVFAGSKMAVDSRMTFVQCLPSTIVVEASYSQVTGNLPEFFNDAVAIWISIQELVKPSVYIMAHLFSSLGPKAAQMSKVLRSNRVTLDIVEVAALRDLALADSSVAYKSESPKKREPRASLPDLAQASKVPSFMLQEIMHSYKMRVVESLGAKSTKSEAEDELQISKAPLRARPFQALYSNKCESVLESDADEGDGVKSNATTPKVSGPSASPKGSLFLGSPKGCFKVIEASNSFRQKRQGMHGSCFEHVSSVEIQDIPKSRSTRNVIHKAFKGCILFDDMDNET
eukprot:9481649-Pyramimonas_sp.AAC.1